MFPCSHVYFTRQGYVADLEQGDDALFDVAVGLCPDMDEVFRRWPTLRCLYEGTDEVLHRDCHDLASLAEEMYPPYRAIRGMGIHVAQDETMHAFIDTYSSSFSEELSGVLGREVTELQAHEGMEMYIEDRVLERQPSLARDLAKSLRDIRPHLKPLSHVLGYYYRERGYPVRPASFYNAMHVGAAIGRFALKTQKQRHFLSKSASHLRATGVKRPPLSSEGLWGRLYSWCIDTVGSSCLSYYDSSLSGLLPSPYDEQTDLSQIMNSYRKSGSLQGFRHLDALINDFEKGLWSDRSYLLHH